MGLLTADYYKNLMSKSSAPATPALVVPVAPVAAAPETAPAPAINFNTPPPIDTSAPITAATMTPPMLPGVSKFVNSLPQQSDINTVQPTNKTGYALNQPWAVGARSFLYSAANKILGIGGVQLPDEDSFNKMGPTQQVVDTLGSAAGATVGMIAGLPKAIVGGTLRTTASILAPVDKIIHGEPFDLKSLENDPNRATLPWVGEIPTMYQSYGDARKSGMGPLASLLQTVGGVAGDAAMGASMVDTMTSAFRPRAALKPGEQVTNTAPITKAINAETKVYQQKAPSDNEYYSLPQTVAKDKYGGTSANTFLKVTPAGDGQVEVSVVQTKGGPVSRGVSYVKSKLGIPEKTIQGDFGPEVKLDSATVPITTPAAAAPEAASTEAFAKPTAAPEAAPGAPIQSIARPMKGFEDRPITNDQLGNLQKIGEVNGIDPAIRDSVIRTITGKDNIGELTQKEYSEVAQTLGNFNDLKKYSPPDAVPNMPSRYISPQRYWMRSVEQKTGVPLYSEAYAPLEDATRLRNVFRESYRNQAREIFGDYASPGKGEERRAIFNYMQGSKDAVLDNPHFDAKTKADLMSISEQMRPLYDKLGNQFGIPTDVFLKDYQPHIQNVGGVYQMYKDGQTIPKAMSFFADFKRHGSLNVQLDDALALWDIYTNAGSNKLFINPALERIAALGDKVPANLQGSLKSYVQEKLGYAGPLEEWLNTMGTNIGQKLGLNVPPDVARQMTDVAMSTTYAGAMGLNPGIAVRNALQGPLMTFPRLGAKFYVQSYKAALSKAGMDEFKASGFPVNLGSPYGEAVQEGGVTAGAVPAGAVAGAALGGAAGGPVGAAIGGAAGGLLGKVIGPQRWKNMTQATLAHHSLAENLNRAQTYFQVKYQFEDALSRYNSGKITWPKFEKEIDLNALNPVDRNIVRQKLVAGDIEGARLHMTRDILDETQFPYRKGASARINYGLPGKLTTQFSQWPIEFGHTIKKWIGDGFLRGDFSKLIRFAGAANAVQQTFRQNFGFDFSKSVGTGPLNPSFAPLVQSAIDTQQMVQAAQQGNDQEYEKNKDALVREVTSLGVPAGGELSRIKDFVAAYKKGPDANGKYDAMDSKGRLLYKTDFKDLFWTAMGFPSAQKADVYSKNSTMLNAQFQRGIQKSQILQLMQQGKMQQAGALIGQTGIQITPADLQAYYIPLDSRTFQNLPPALKAKFANLIYPAANNQ